MKPHIAPLVGGIVILASVLLWVIYMQTAITPLSGEWKKMFKAPAEELTAYAREHPLRLRNKKIQDEDISESTFVGAEFTNVVWDDVVAQDGRFVDATFSGGSMHDTSFAFSELKNVTFKQVTFAKSGFSKSKMTNVVFEDCQMDETAFVGAELINVTFRNCKIYNSEIRNLINSKVLVENSEIFDTNFFDSQVAMIFRNVKVERKAYMTDLAEGSTVLIEDSHIGPYSDFSRSRLLSFVIRNTTIDNSRANGITAKKVILDNVVSDFAIADSTIGVAEISNLSGVFSFGESRIKTVSVEGCQNGSKVYLHMTKADDVKIRKCNAAKLVLDSAVVNNLWISYSNVEWMVLKSLKAGALKLHQVAIASKLFASNAVAENVLQADWTRLPNVAIEAEGSNLPLPTQQPQ